MQRPWGLGLIFQIVFDLDCIGNTKISRWGGGGGGVGARSFGVDWGEGVYIPAQGGIYTLSLSGRGVGCLSSVWSRPESSTLGVETGRKFVLVRRESASELGHRIWGA